MSFQRIEMRRKHPVIIECVAILGIGVLWLALGMPGSARGDTFSQTVEPFLTRYCSDCHGATTQESDFSVDRLTADLNDDDSRTSWTRIQERLLLGEMPPAGEPRADAKATAEVIEWMDTTLATAGVDTSQIRKKLSHPDYGNRVDHDALFSADPATPTASEPRLWRYSPYLYVGFRDRVRRNAPTAQPFSLSPSPGFQDYDALFAIDEPTIAQLMRNADAIVELELVERGGVQELRALITDEGTLPSKKVIERGLDRQFELLLARAPSAEERQRLVALLHKNVADAGLEQGVRSTLAAMFLLPEAVYRLELGVGPADEHGRRMLAPRELAFAIAYALTDQAPDVELRTAADKGRLANRADVQREVQRILTDPSLEKRRIMRFFEEYFEFDVAEQTFKDLKPGEWKPDVLVEDTRHLIRMILKEDRDVLGQLLTTNRSFVNFHRNPQGKAFPAKPARSNRPVYSLDRGRLFPVPSLELHDKLEVHDYYSLPYNWQWTPDQPLELPAEQRAGVLTQPSWLAAFATNDENDPIHRGKWIRERLLGGAVPDVPITVDAQLPHAPEDTLRERMKVTEAASCWQCHRQMNPLGLTLESYDFIGRYRTVEKVLALPADSQAAPPPEDDSPRNFREVPIDSSGKVVVPGVTELDSEHRDFVQLIHHLAESDRVRQVFVRHAFRYWMGRNETVADGPTLVAADQVYVRSGGSMHALIVSLLTSDSFIYRRAVPPIPTPR